MPRQRRLVAAIFAGLMCLVLAFVAMRGPAAPAEAQVPKPTPSVPMPTAAPTPPPPVPKPAPGGTPTPPAATPTPTPTSTSVPTFTPAPTPTPAGPQPKPTPGTGPTPSPSPSSAPIAVAFQPVVSGLASPLFVTHAADGSGRLFIVEQGGRVRIAVAGTLPAQPFVDISALLGSTGGEQGLLGMAFHPNYRQNGRFFLAYTGAATSGTVGDNVVAEFRVTADPNRADPTPRVLLAIPDRFTNHNGGMLTFGPDGYLYIATGDGGSGGDPDNNAQNLGSLLGKMLRLDVNGAQPYAVPPSNPFIKTPGARPEIWAVGLRNPFRFSFDRATGDLWIGDVGQGAREEIDFQPAGSAGGQNYGWNRMEGTLCYPSGLPCALPGLTLPVAEYGHDLGCSVIGGYVYRGSASPVLRGQYVYGDTCSGRVWVLVREGSAFRAAQAGTAPALISSFGEDEAGEMYLTGLNTGIVYRVVGP